MSEVKLTADSLVLSDPTQGHGSVHAAMSQPSAADEQALGRLFFLFSLETQSPQAEELFHKLQTGVSDIYYRNREGTAELNFEKAVQEGNQVFRQFVNDRNRTLLENFHAIIGVVSGSDLYMTATGTIHAFLARGPRIVDILDRNDSVKASPVRVFSHLIAGELRLGDRIVACTTSVLDYISIEKLRQTVSGTPTANACFNLEALLRESSPHHTFGAVVMGMIGATVAPRIPRVESSTPLHVIAPTMAQTSMAELQARSRSTSELLAPSLFQKVKSVGGDLLQKLWLLIRTKVFRLRPRRTIAKPTEVVTYHHAAASRPSSTRYVAMIEKTGSVITGFFTAVGSTLGDIFRRRRSVGESLRQFPQRTNDTINHTVHSYRRLTSTQKRLLISAGVLLLIFAGSIVWRGLGQDASLTEQQKADLTNSIEEKIFQASSALTYGDDTGALALLSEAQSLIEQYPDRTKGDREQINAWQSRVDSEQEKTRHLTRLDSVPVLADLASSNLVAPVGDITLLGTSVYAATADTLVSIDSDGVVATHPLPEHTGAPIQLATMGQNLVLVLTDAGQMIEYTTTNDSFRVVDVPFTNQDRTIGDMATYETRIYFLDTHNNQIYRHTRGSVGYSTGQAWVSDNDVSLTDSAGISIDGTIYTISHGGTLTKLFQGSRVGDFNASQIDPPLTQANAIWTDANATSIYVLDTSERRIIAFTKTGALKGQYTTDQLSTGQGLIVNQAGTTAYTLSGTSILAIPLN